MSTEGITYNDIESHIINTQEVATMSFGSHAKTTAKMNTGQVQNFSTFHIHLPSAFSAAAMIIAALLLLCLGYCLYRQFLIRQHRRRQQVPSVRYATRAEKLGFNQVNQDCGAQMQAGQPTAPLAQHEYVRKKLEDI